MIGFSEYRWRLAFRFKGLYNCLASVLFLFFDDTVRRFLGAPPTDATYRALFLGLAFVFGLGYWRVGNDLAINHDIIRMGVLGQIIVFVVLLHATTIAEPPLPWPLLIPGVIDLGFALAYGYFLARIAPLTAFLALQREVEGLRDGSPKPPTERLGAAIDLREAAEPGLK